MTNAGLFARAVLGRAEAPPVARDIITTMGLLGLEGLTIVDRLPGAGSASPREGPAAEPEEEGEPEVVVRVDKKEVGRALRRGASAVTEALEAMRGPDALALQAALEAGGGTAEVRARGATGGPQSPALRCGGGSPALRSLSGWQWGGEMLGASGERENGSERRWGNTPFPS